MQREPYFTPQTLQTQAQAMLREVAFLRERHADLRFEPEQAALLVLDLQSYFLHPHSHAFVPSGPAILSNIQRLIHRFCHRRRPVVLTRHLNTDENAKMMARWWRRILRPDTPLSTLVADLDCSCGQILLKSQYDAFLYTSLEDMLRRQGVDQVVITGIMTHLCCETTARSAFQRGFTVFFCVDGTATYNRALHNATLLTLSHGFAIPVLCEEIETWLGE